jgi:hypothetical protein
MCLYSDRQSLYIKFAYISTVWGREPHLQIKAHLVSLLVEPSEKAMSRGDLEPEF